MFCYQCEQTAKGIGCTVAGVCGKDARVAALQDLLIHGTKRIAMYAHRARQHGARNPEVDLFVLTALYTTVTNVNFDEGRIIGMLRDCARLRDKACFLYESAARSAGVEPERLGGPTSWEPGAGADELVERGEAASIQARIARNGEELTGTCQLVLYGLKGMAAYAYHAHELGVTDEDVQAFLHEALSFLVEETSLNGLLGMALRVGEMNLRVMEVLDQAHTTAYGHPVPTKVRIAPVKGKAILVSGHDLKDLEELLRQTEGAGINVYTHGEMLPAHGYPGLKKYPHLVGNYGGAWQDQRKEFDDFPGAILMTTNCIQAPKGSYVRRIFTAGVVAWPGVRHIGGRDFSPVIEAARAERGFDHDAPEKSIVVGFGHSAVMNVAGDVVEAVKRGDIRHFFLIGGCDGAKSGRNYYTDLAQAVPNDCVVLTLACGKYRFNRLDFGTIGGIPRLLDIGQCNDAYSAIKIAAALAEAFGTDVNGLPLTLVLSWYEQKAVGILLTLLHLGVKNIRIGPSLPAFLLPAVVELLQRKFGLMPIGDPQNDLKSVLG
jgi:hydroxylamine reductase